MAIESLEQRDELEKKLAQLSAILRACADPAFLENGEHTQGNIIWLASDLADSCEALFGVIDRADRVAYQASQLIAKVKH